MRTRAAIAAALLATAGLLTGCSNDPPSDGEYHPDERPDVVDENGDDVDAPDPEPSMVEITRCELLPGEDAVLIDTSGLSHDGQIHYLMVMFAVNGVETQWTPVTTVPEEVLEHHRAESPAMFEQVVPVPPGTTEVTCTVEAVS